MGFYKQYFIYLIIYINTTTNKQKYRTKFRGISVQNPFPEAKFYFLKWDYSRIDNEFLFLGLHCSEKLVPKQFLLKGVHGETPDAEKLLDKLEPSEKFHLSSFLCNLDN